MTVDRRLPTGQQYEISLGGATARIGSVAAVLREFSVDGVHYTETWDDQKPTPAGCGIVLAPWPNRIQDATWTLDGASMKLDMTDRGNNCAIHGLLRNTSYDLVEHDDTSVTLAAGIYPQHGYPFTLNNTVTYRLDAEGLQVTHRLDNVGEQTAPFGIGAHPYLTVGDTPIADLTVQLDATTYYLANDQKVATGTASVDGTRFDLRRPQRLGDVELDTCYTDVATSDGRHRMHLTAPDRSGLTLWADPAFGHLQVFTTREFPGRDLAVAVEPMTCAANAFNSSAGLRWLTPGEVFQASWGLTPVNR